MLIKWVLHEPLLENAEALALMRSYPTERMYHQPRMPGEQIET